MALFGKPLGFIENIILGWKGLTMTNTLAYYEPSKTAAINSFITLGPVRLKNIIYFYCMLSIDKG